MTGKSNIETKYYILSKLIEKKSFVSGEEISKELNISRTMVWKYVEQLIKEGIEIESSPKKGYKILKIPEMIIPTFIKSKLHTKRIGKKIILFEEIDSTNTYCMANSDNLEDGTVVITKHQIRGKGRFGREWISSKDKDITMSILLKPNKSLENIFKITASASLAVLYAVRDFDLDTPEKFGIKWPNDIYYESKKLCGILSEVKLEYSSRITEAVVIGIGLNVNSTISEKINNATSLFEISGYEISRNSIISKILNYFESILEDDFSKTFENWKSNLLYLGKNIYVIHGDTVIYGKFIDVNTEGNLILDINGDLKMFTYGEISIKAG